MPLSDSDIKKMVEINAEIEKEPWHVFICYGCFTDPLTKKNFVIVRMPRGKRLKWSKVFAPAMNRILKPWMDDSKDGYWNVEGEGNRACNDGHGKLKISPPLWETKINVRKFTWEGAEIKQEYPEME